MPFKIKKTVSSLAPSGNSVLFNGTNQYLSIANNAAFQLGTGDFTAECWTYATSMPQSFARLLSVAGTYGGSNVGLEINISTSAAPVNSIEFTINGNNTTYFRISTNSAISINTWYHVAVTRISGTIYCFLNGVLQTSSTSGASTNINGSGGVTVAAAIGGGAYWPGYVSNVRILKGTALYTASFTVPTAPLTAITNTSLLTCQSATIIDNSTNNFTITNNNGATVSSTVTPFSVSFSPFKIKKNNVNLNSGFKLKHVSYVRPVYGFTISPAYSGKSTWDLTVDGPLTLTGSGAWTIVPISNFNTTVKMWGAGGARGYSYRDAITSTNSQGPGGGGGYSTANISIQSGVSYIVQVGQGGVRTNTASSGATYLAGGVQGSSGGTQGGGYSGMFITSVSQSNALLMAGGGGGGSDNGFSSNGGAGGGSSGQDSAGGNQGGNGGSQSAGGGAAAYNGPTAGSALVGGLGSANVSGASLGGGGGGYWGGGGGNVGGGGGGSGRIGTNASVTSGTTTAGAADVPGNSSDASRGGAGRGGNATSNTGADGTIIITKI